MPVLFLHFFDTHFLELQGRGRPRETIAKECRLATRLSYLSAEVLYVPAASYFESELCREIIDEFQPLFDCSILYLVGGGANIFEFVEEKRAQYKRDSPAHMIYFRTLQSHLPPYKSRTRSATKQIAHEWHTHLELGKAPDLFDGTDAKVPKRFERNWEKLPERLGKSAFILDHVRLLLFPKVENRTVLSRTQEIIDKAYFESFTLEYEAGVVRHLSWLETSHRVPSSGLDLSYRTVVGEARRNGLLARILAADAIALEHIRHDALWLGTLAACLATMTRPAHLGGQAVPFGHGGKRPKEKADMDPPRSVAIRTEPQWGGVPTIGIITALSKEFVAVKVLLENPRDHFIPGNGAGRRYILGEVSAAKGGKHTVVLALLSDTGNNQAAARATLLLEHFPKVEEIVMTGIAGAVPNPTKAEEHVRLGDLIVSNRYGVIQYDFVKKEHHRDDEGEWEEDIHRHPPRAPSALLHEAANHLEAGELEGNRPWDELIEEACRQLHISRPPEATDTLARSDNPSRMVRHPDDSDRKIGLPRVFRGPIASANILLKDPIKRDALRDKFGVRAVEMETSGISDATWNRGAGYLGVRSGCDYCDKHKGDAWQKYAAAVAAGYAIALIQTVPLQPGERSDGLLAPAATTAADQGQDTQPRGEGLEALPENELRRLLDVRLGREEIAALWFDTLGELMGDDMDGKGKSECIIELIARANRRNLKNVLIGNIRQERPDLAG